MSIQVYRSSFDSAWHLNDEGADAVKASFGAVDLPDEVSPGAVAALPEGSDPTRPGYAFKGWNAESDGSGAWIGIDATPRPAEGESLEFWAIWEAVPYTLYFDLSKNPDETTLSASLDWPGHSAIEISKNIFQVDGVTVEAGPKGQVPLPGVADVKRTDYRFLGWADGESVPVSRAADGTWMLDATSLPSSGATLTARFAFKFGVTVPAEITFGRYDLLNQAGQGYGTHESSSQTNLDGSDGEPGAGEAAYFQSATLSADLELVGLQSTRTEGAEDVIFPKEGGLEAVFDQPLLSLFPLPGGADGAEPHGVHFKLDDTKAEDAFVGKGFGIPKGSKLFASYRLNLDTQWADGTANAAIVGNDVTAGDAKTRIATVSYEFALAGESMAPSTIRALEPDGDTSTFYVEVTEAFVEAHGLERDAGVGVYGIASLKRLSQRLASYGNDAALKESSDYSFAFNLMEEKVPFVLKLGGGSVAPQPFHIIGICDDVDRDGHVVGLTFASVDHYDASRCFAVNDMASQKGWTSNDNMVRNYLLSTFLPSLSDRMRGSIVAVRKYQQVLGGTTAAQLQGPAYEEAFVPSLHEVFGSVADSSTGAESLTSVEGYTPFQYDYFKGSGSTSTTNPRAAKAGSSKGNRWWLRSGTPSVQFGIWAIADGGMWSNDYPTEVHGVVPCFAI